MSKPPTPRLSKELSASLRAAETLAADERVIAAFHTAADNSRLRAQALGDPAKFLAERKIDVPPSLHVQFMDVELGGRPYPFGEFFTVVLTKCRTFWVRERGTDGKLGNWQQVTVCFGLEIFPKRWPFGPIA